LGPFVFLIVHAYVLLHFVFLAGKISAFNAELHAQISSDDARARLRRQLPSNIFVQFLAGPPEVRTPTIRLLLWLITRISFVFGPITLLILFQLQFLPYHSEWITWWHRIVVVIDLVILWVLWPPIARIDAAPLRLSDFKRGNVRAWLLVTCLPILLVFTIATFPGELLEEKLPAVGLVPTTWQAWTLPSVQAIQAPGSGWATLHELLVAGEVNYVTGRPQSLWSNVLVLPNLDVGDRVLSMRGRSLEGVVLVFAHLRKADFSGASLTGAHFTGADLREAKFEPNWIHGGSPGFLPIGYTKDLACNKDIGCAQLQGADFSLAQLQGASLARAELQDAIFMGARLQGASLDQAQLQGAGFPGAQLQGASLVLAELQGAYLVGVQLQGANLNQAQLEGAELFDAQLQGANLDNAQLQGAVLALADTQGVPLNVARLDGASLRHAYVWRTNPLIAADALVDAPEPGPKYLWLDCPAGECNWSKTSYEALKSLIENSVPTVGGRYQALWRIAILEKPPYIAYEVWAKAWTDLAKGSAGSAGSYFDTLAKIWKGIGCAADGAPYVIGALISRLDHRSGRNLSKWAEVAGAFLDEPRCPGARGLSEENKAKLQEIRDRGLPAPPGLGAAAR
jgi:uncharacterized protein YjbI with pentapeptide repeats